MAVGFTEFLHIELVILFQLFQSVGLQNVGK